MTALRAILRPFDLAAGAAILLGTLVLAPFLVLGHFIATPIRAYAARLDRMDLGRRPRLP